MRIGLPKEIKNHEYRVGLTPAGVRELTSRGHEVVVQTAAGAEIGLSDDAYKTAGASVVETAQEVFSTAEMIIKVKEPQPAECAMLRAGQILYTYLHLAPDPDQTRALIDSKAVCIAYETITGPGGGLPLLAPMSEVAGRMSIQAGAAHLEKSKGGMALLLGGVPGVAPAHVVIIGAGVVGTNALQIAMGMGARVTIIDKNLERLRALDRDLRQPRHHAILEHTDNRGFSARRGSPDRRRAHPRRGRAEARDPRHDFAYEAGRRGCRRRHRSGRLLRDVPAHDPYRSDFRRGQRRSLLRGQHAGRGCANLDIRAHERDDRPRAGDRGQGMEARVV